MPEALIFDFDGLILDTEVPVYEAWRENYRAHGHDLPLDIYAGCVGSDFARFDPKGHLESLTGDTIDWDHWDRRRSVMAREMILETPPFPGVAELLAEASEAGIPCAVASSSPRSWVVGHLERLELIDHFHSTRCLDDVSEPKPSPELFLAAAEAIKAPTHAALVLEDSLNGLHASLAARIDCVIVPNQVTCQLDFEGAAAVLPTLENVTLDLLAGIKASAS